MLHVLPVLSLRVVFQQDGDGMKIRAGLLESWIALYAQTSFMIVE